jgi:hypothetical protein
MSAKDLLRLCGERGIRTLDTLLAYTRFPGEPVQPLRHLSKARLVRYGVARWKARVIKYKVVRLTLRPKAEMSVEQPCIPEQPCIHCKHHKKKEPPLLEAPSKSPLSLKKRGAGGELDHPKERGLGRVNSPTPLASMQSREPCRRCRSPLQQHPLGWQVHSVPAHAQHRSCPRHR